MCAHLTAHSQHYARRLQDYQHIVQTLLFSPVRPGTQAATIYDTTHLFFFGDLNFRIAADGNDASKKSGLVTADILAQNGTLKGRQALKQHDQLTRAKNQGKAFLGLREGEVEQFPLTFKYVIGSVHDYRFVLHLLSRETLLTCSTTVARELLPGQTESYIPPRPITPSTQSTQISRTSYTHPFSLLQKVIINR